MRAGRWSLAAVAGPAIEVGAAGVRGRRGRRARVSICRQASLGSPPNARRTASPTWSLGTAFPFRALDTAPVEQLAFRAIASMVGVPARSRSMRRCLAKGLAAESSSGVCSSVLSEVIL